MRDKVSAVRENTTRRPYHEEKKPTQNFELCACCDDGGWCDLPGGRGDAGKPEGPCVHEVWGKLRRGVRAPQL